MFFHGRISGREKRERGTGSEEEISIQVFYLNLRHDVSFSQKREISSSCTLTILKVLFPVTNFSQEKKEQEESDDDDDQSQDQVTRVQKSPQKECNSPKVVTNFSFIPQDQNSGWSQGQEILLIIFSLQMFGGCGFGFDPKNHDDDHHEGYKKWEEMKRKRSMKLVCIMIITLLLLIISIMICILMILIFMTVILIHI